MKKTKLILMLAMLALLLGGCVQPDSTLEPLTISDNTIPFGTVQPLPTDTPTPEPQPTETPEGWSAEEQNVWEDWATEGLPTTTPKAAATAAPDAVSWQTSDQDYNAGYPVLMLGSVGEDVSDLQARLLELGYYSGTIDGKFSTATQSAVIAFQERSGLTADGIAGRRTQDLLYSGSAVPKAISADASNEGYVLLKSGTAGLEVRKLQARLLELGYYAGGVDGIYGDTTVSAVKAFQKANGLSADGQAGEQTQTKLYSTSARYASAPVTTADPDAVRTLTVGMSGNDVYALQERLIELRYLGGVADGVFGSETQTALKAFQQNNGLTPSGEANAATQRKLAGSCKAASAAQTQAGGTLHEGDSGEAVYLLQARLFELGYFSGRIDGRLGSETTDAIRAFQKANGLTADGIAGAGTQKQLNSNSAKPADSVIEEVSAGSVPSSTLKRGMTGSEVSSLQQALRDLGYTSSAPDGQFGSGTERAVKLFQEANGLTADGVAGMGTITILFSGDAVPYSSYFGANGSKGTTPVPETQTVRPTPTPNVNTTIQWESTGSDVTIYQTRLAELGYLATRYITGKFNQQTVDATKAFQRNNDLKVDGAAGVNTLKLIYSGDALDVNGQKVGKQY